MVCADAIRQTHNGMVWDGKNDAVLHVKRPTERDPVVYDAAVAFRSFESKAAVDFIWEQRRKFYAVELKQSKGTR